MNNRTLGTIAMICAPAMLVEGLIEELFLGGQDNAQITGVAGMVFMSGWICSNTAMRRTRAAGTGKWSRAVLLIQLAGLALAFMFGFFEATRLLGWESIVFKITDAAWPLSMVWMLLPVGITVIVAKRLSGWRRFVPLLCPLWLPIALSGAAFGDTAADTAGFVGLGFSAVLWLLLGYIVRGGDRQTALAPEPAVQ